MVPECVRSLLAYFEEKEKSAGGYRKFRKMNIRKINIWQGIEKILFSPRVPPGCSLAVAVAPALGNDGFALLPELCINELGEELLTLAVATEQTSVDVQQEPRAWVDE